MTESCKKKLLELIYWLPKINRFLFTKLSILILKKSLSIVNTNQILGILKTRLDTKDAEPPFELMDYLMFLTSLFNGSSGFDLMNSTSPAALTKEFFSLDCAKFNKHVKLCNHLEQFVTSHKNSDKIISLIITTTIPIFVRIFVFNFG